MLTITGLLLALTVSGCAQKQWHTYRTLPKLIQEEGIAPDPGQDDFTTASTEGQTGPRSKELEPVPPVRHKVTDGGAAGSLVLPDKELLLNADNLPFTRFIDLALGESLELNYEIAPELANRTDPITLHVSKPVSADQLFGMIQSTLLLYKVGLIASNSGTVQVVPATALRSSPPVLDVQNEVRASKLQLGRVIEFIPLNYINGTAAAEFAQLFINREAGDELRFVPSLNALMLIASPESLPRLREAITVLDRPALQSQTLKLIRPVYWPAKNLIPVVRDMLTAQGVPIRANMSQPGPGVFFFSIDELNAMVMVSPQRAWQRAAENIINELDVPDAAGRGSQVFVYYLKNTRAQDLGRVVSQALGQASAGSEGGAAQAITAAAPIGGLEGLNVIIDEKRNALIFIGDANVYQGILPLLQSLDRTPRQVMLEVTIAEVTLGEANALGIVWNAQNVSLGSTTMVMGTGAVGPVSGEANSDMPSVGGLALPSGGFGVIANNRNISAQLAALASERKAKILSTPRILVMDGESANLVIGDQISVITSEVTNSASNGNSVRGFSFVETGVILDISPTINEGGLVQMELTQEVSLAGEAPAGGNPNINQRKIQTRMVAKSGQTVVIGGMISHNLTSQKSKVPILGDIPLLGALFSSSSGSDSTTELILMVTPYVIGSTEEAEHISNAMKEQLQWFGELFPDFEATPSE